MHFPLFQNGAGDILGVGRKAQAQGGLIGFFGVFKKFHPPGGPAHEHRQHAGGHGVQGAAVADAAGIEHPAQPGGHILAGPVLGFIDNDDSVHFPSVAARMASSRALAASARGR